MNLFEFALNYKNHLPDFGAAKIGMVGAGKMAIEHSEVLKNGFRNTDLVAVCSRTDTSAQKIKERFQYRNCYTNIHKMLANHPEINVLIIAVSHEFSYSVLKELIPYKRYMLVEKPIAYTKNESLELLKLSGDHYDKIMVGVNRRFYSTVQNAKLNLLRQGAIRSMLVETNEPLKAYRNRGNYDSWLYDKWFLANSIHLVDLFRFYLGDLKKVLHKRIVPDEGYYALASYEYGEGVLSSTFDSSALSGFKIYGTGVSASFYNDDIGEILYPKKKVKLLSSSMENKFKPGLYNQMNYFLSKVIKNEEISYPASNLSDHCKSIELAIELSTAVH